MESKVGKIDALAKRLGLKMRLVLRDGYVTRWSSWLGEPSPSYVELPGPYRKRDVQFVVIDGIESRFIGARVANRSFDRTEELERGLNELNIAYEIDADGYYCLRMESLYVATPEG